jgi:hypothetical protein
MMFLIRMTFWVSVLCLVLPLGGADGPNTEDKAQIDALSALAAAGATVSDMGGFCERQPDACAVGSQALRLVGERARNGAALIQDYLGGEAAAPAHAAGPAASRSRDTLTPADRKPGWRGEDRSA